MLIGKFVSNCLEENINEIKFAALYYDQIEILENHVYTLTKPDEQGYCYVRGATKCIHENFYSNIMPLIDEGIIQFYESKELRIAPAERNDNETIISELEEKILGKTYEVMNNVGNRIFYLHNKNRLSFLSPEVKKIHEAYIDEIRINATLDLEFLHTYYANLIFEMLMCIYKGENAITSSEVVDSYFKNFYLSNPIDNKFAISRGNLGVRTINQLVPNVSSLSFEEILELRYKCKDELENYRYFVAQLNQQLLSTEEYDRIEADINAYIDTKIGHSLRELEQKILQSKFKVGKYFLDGLKDMRSYTPLIGSIFLNVPTQISLLLSLGLVGTDIILKWKENNISIKNNGLYYLYDIAHRI